MIEVVAQSAIREIAYVLGKLLEIVEKSEMNIAFASGSGLGSVLLALVALFFIMRVKLPKKSVKYLVNAASMKLKKPKQSDQ